MENDFFADTRTQLNILVVDDNQVNLKIMLAVLTGVGHTVETAKSGE